MNSSSTTSSSSTETLIKCDLLKDTDASDSLHSLGTETICLEADSTTAPICNRPTNMDNNNNTIIVSRTLSDINSVLRGEKENVLPTKNVTAVSSQGVGVSVGGNIRVRHHNHTISAAELDRRSEASSEQTRVSKFKVVKLESKAPYCRGRWQCFDFHDRPKDQSRTGNPDRISSAEQSSTSTTATVTSVPLVTSTTSSVSDPLETSSVQPNSNASTLRPPTTKFKITAVQLPPNTSAISALIRPSNSQDLHVSGSHSMEIGQSSNEVVPSDRRADKSGDVELHISDSHAALSAELSRRTTLDASANGTKEATGLSLDNKIRQCMDLVGNHLIIAVRGELEQLSSEVIKLREQLEQLEFENNALRSENAILRNTAGASTADAQHRSQPSRRK